ncbi:PAS domain-containing protein [Arcobacter sp. FWKO B]|uniref:PAS domain-containing sensor histidine kinase n=1 Tax=Arcobacter sp. FWKO B TaxID=2593672 RepID=UPI0018A48B98|nr:PAS domain-containing protein [Arcobacter sp. FWKO B]QOG12737.1 PAS domain S-box protein [Arcobacter sp. FWKO B]
MNKRHYLEIELYQLIQKDSSMFEFIQNGSLDGLWYWDLENPENEWMSPKFWKVLGYNPSEKKHFASSWQDIIYHEDLEIALKNLKKHIENKNHPYDQVVRYKHKNSSTVWIRCRGIAIRDKNGKAIRMLGAHNDITNEKRLEEKYLQKSNALKAILDISLDGIMAFDALYDNSGEIVDFVWTMSNKKACEIINIKEEDLIGKKLSLIMPGNFIPLDSIGGQTLFENYKEVVETGKPKILEFYFAYDNIKEWFENKAVKYNNGFVVTFGIITEKKQLQLNLEQIVNEEVAKNNQNQKLLFQQSKLAEMGMMLNMIAHQWRQPLNHISLIFNNIILKFQKNQLTISEANELRNNFQNQINYMSKTIDDFKDFFKPTKQKSLFEISKIINETIDLIKPSIKESRINLIVDSENLIEYFGYKNELKQVLLNIINNSKDSLLESKTKEKYIKIVAKKVDNNIIIKCEDNGRGIDTNIIDNIFDPYFSTKISKNGTGLGLYMAKTIIQKHFQGTITIQSNNNSTIFIIKL